MNKTEVLHTLLLCIGATALACAAEHSVRREAAAAAAREAPAGAPTPAPKPVAVL